ncbi:phosphonate ABC transporter, permease protein PhnE, partial [Comamonas sp.]|uniref:phosphonate ABC transporter, permease protein PhnE n=1 Tax=Comamonas sp. TaxID=34028 RepID=UPI0028A6394C
MPAAANDAQRRDPAARGRLIALLLALVVLWPMLQTSGFSLAPFFDSNNLKVVGGFLAQFLPPETSHEFLAYLGQASLETLAIATAGMALALLLALLLALPLSYLASGAAREKVSLNPLTRGVLTILRGVPELVWALVFVRVFGLGPAAGVLALGLTYGGMLAKVYAEILESTDPAPARALRASGAGRLQALLYGSLPQAARELTSYTVYRWECAIRASVVMGFVGAGGLGQLMDQAMKMLNGGEVASILLAFMLLVALADLLSWWLRRALDTPPAARALPFGWRSAAMLLLGGIGLWASFWLLGIDWSALFSRDALQSMGSFVACFFSPDLSAA